MQKGLSLKNIKKRYGQTDILKGINLEVEAGEFLILVGPSGCGKSTLLNMIAGLEKGGEGEIKIGERLVNGVPPKDRDIAMVFQNYALYPNMNVQKNITFGMEMRKVPKALRQERLAYVAKVLQIEHLLERRPAELSGGQRQRVAMGRALAREPGLFLFDEPLSNLDAKLRVEMRMEIKRLHLRTQTTIVYVTHDQIEAMTLGDRIAVMKEGLIQQFGTPQEIYEAPANLFVAGFMGSPSMNFIRCALRQSTSGLAAEWWHAGEQRSFNLAPNPKLKHYVGQDIVVGLRPEMIAIATSVIAKPTVQTYDCQVSLVQLTGPDAFLSIEINDQEVVCRVSARALCAPGQRIQLAFDLGQMVLFDAQTEQRIA